MKRQEKSKTTALRAMRTARGMTLHELAAKAALSYSRVQKIDAGDADAGQIRTKFLLSRALADRKFELWEPDARADLRRLAEMK